jgi:hypothetical protein
MMIIVIVLLSLIIAQGENPLQTRLWLQEGCHQKVVMMTMTMMFVNMNVLKMKMKMKMKMNLKVVAPLPPLSLPT